MTHPLTPVIIGVGQYTDRLDSPQYRGLSSIEPRRLDSEGLRLPCLIAGEAIQILGSNGCINEFPTPRLWRDANSTRSVPAPRRFAEC